MPVLIEQVRDQIVFGCRCHDGAPKITGLGCAVGQSDFAVDVRCLAPPASFEQKIRFFAETVNQHFDFGADFLAQPSRVEFTLSGQQLALSFFDDLLWHKVVAIAGGSAFFMGIGEHAEMIRRCVVKEVAELAEIGIGFTRMSNKECGSQDKFGDRLSQSIDGIAQALAAVAPSHGAKHIIARVLEGHIDVRKHRRVLIHQREQVGVEFFRVEVMESKPFQIGDVGESFCEAGEVGALFAVPPIGCLLYTSPSPRDRTRSRMPSSA